MKRRPQPAPLPPLQAPPEPSSDLLAYTVEEAARMISVSRSTMYKLVKSGEIPSKPVCSRKRVVPRVELERYLSRGLTNGPCLPG